MSAIKVILLVAVCLSGTVVIGSYSKTWLSKHLVADFDSLDNQTKQTRLTQVAGLGIPGIDPLVNALADKDLQVARTAHELLQEVQNRWTEMERPEQARHQLALAKSLHAIAVQLPDDRTSWGTSLLQQAVALSVNRPDTDSRNLFRTATRAMDLLALTERAGPSVLSNDPIEPSEPRLTIRSYPKSTSVEDQTLALEVSSHEQNLKPVDLSGQRQSSSTGATIVARSISKSREPSVYRSGTSVKLRPTGREEPVALKNIDPSHETSYQAKPLESVAHVVESPMQALDDESVMQWLGSPHTPMRERANAELLSRGFSETDIAIATQISAGDTASRLTMIDAIARSDQIDPRPWLFLLLGDQNRQVKLRAISVLATMQDAYVEQRLRMRIADEPDAAVVAQIRNALERR